MSASHGADGRKLAAGTPAGAQQPCELDEALLRAWALPGVAEDADKEARGRVLVVAGSREIAGAAVLAATAALRAGAGKLVVATPQSAWAVVAAALPEARVIPLAETPEGGPAAGEFERLRKGAEDTAALLVGPGMTDRPATLEFLRGLLPLYRHAPVVLDALAMDLVPALGRLSQPVLVTPHAGEMAHLSGREKEEIAADPLAVAHRHAGEWNVTVALKGALTCIAGPDGACWRHQGGTAGLATSGSGDVLAGIVAGLAARGASLPQAAAWGVALHARAGEALARRLGPIGFLARELAAEVPGLMRSLGTPAG